MTGLMLALIAALGAFYLYSAFTLRWTGLGFGPKLTQTRSTRPSLTDWMERAGLSDVGTTEFVAVVIAISLLAMGASYVMFGALAISLVAGAFGASVPVMSFRRRAEQRMRNAQDAWPRMLEEIRILTGSLGRSVPQALFDVGRRGPVELRPAFEAAHREWMITTNFERTIGILKAKLADPTGDAACETLLIAHELGGSDLDRRLDALIADRIQDVQGRKDSRSKQAGARFARRFVLIVPLGMALAGHSIGNGRAAYQTAIGQIMVIVGLLLIAVCWTWAGAVMRLPQEERVFS